MGYRLLAAIVVLCAIAGWIGVALTMLGDQSKPGFDVLIYVGLIGPALSVVYRLLYLIFHFGTPGKP